MIKTFCDNCGEEASVSAQRFEGLSQGLTGFDVGLEVLLLVEKGTGPDHHICDECMPSLLIKAAKTFHTAVVVQEQFGAINRGFEAERKNKQLDAREAKLAQRENAVKAKEAELREVGSLRSRVAQLTDGMEERVRKEVAARLQSKTDLEDNPQLGRRVRLPIGSNAR
jgi:hypothetical protein